MALNPNEAIIDPRFTCHSIAATDTSHTEVQNPNYIRMTFTKQQFEVLVQSLQRQLDEQGENLVAVDLVARKMETSNDFGNYGLELTLGTDGGSFPFSARRR